MWCTRSIVIGTSTPLRPRSDPCSEMSEEAGLSGCGIGAAVKRYDPFLQ